MSYTTDIGKNLRQIIIKATNLQVSNNAAFKSDYEATYGDASENGLALALFRQRVYVSWTGTDSHLNMAVLSPGEFRVFGLLP